MKFKSVVVTPIAIFLQLWSCVRISCDGFVCCWQVSSFIRAVKRCRVSQKLLWPITSPGRVLQPTAVFSGCVAAH